VYKEVVAHSTKSTKASIDKSDLLQYITAACIGDGAYKGTTHSVILHWQDCIRRYESKADAVHHFSDVMLQNAVHPLEELHMVKLTADQNRVLTGRTLMYEEYSKLLCSTALSYDAQFKTRTCWARQVAAARHAMHTHLMTSQDNQTGDIATLYNIDTGINVIQANLTNQQPLSTWLPMPLWDKISGNAQMLWKTIPIGDCASILAHFMLAHTERPPGRAKTPAIHSYLHEIAIADEDPVPSINSAMDMSSE
jgi:hypothetical protein